MSSEYTQYVDERVKETLDRLQNRNLNEEETVSCLRELSDFIYRDGDLKAKRYIPQLQRTLLVQIIPSLISTSGDSRLNSSSKEVSELIRRFFVPNNVEHLSSSVNGEIALSGYSTLLSRPFTSNFEIELVQKLLDGYPINSVYVVVFSEKRSGRAKEREWDDFVKDLFAIPGRIANFVYTNGDHSVISDSLSYATYFTNLGVRIEELIYRISPSEITNLTSIVTKMLNTGLFPASVPIQRSQPSFFVSVLHAIRVRLSSLPPKEREAYRRKWHKLWKELPTSGNVSTVMTSLLSTIHHDLSSSSSSSSTGLILSDSLDLSSKTRALIKREAILLASIIGSVSGVEEDEGKEMWESISSCLFNGRKWDEVIARIVVCWAAMCPIGKDGKEKDQMTVNVNGLLSLLSHTLQIYTSTEHITHSLLAFHKYTSSLLLLTISALSSPHPLQASARNAIASLPYDPAFISATSTYLSHMDTSIRRCGMMVGEEIVKSARACEGKEGKEGVTLDFGGWDTDENVDRGNKSKDMEILRWCKALRELIHSGQDANIDENGLPSEEDEISFMHVESDHNNTSVASYANLTKISLQRPQETALTFSVESDDEPLPQTHFPDSDDDSLVGYSTHSRTQSPTRSVSVSPSSSRSPSPTPSLMKQYETDPTLFVGSSANKGKKGKAPVYLLDLVSILRDPGPSSNASGNSIGVSGRGGDESKESVSDYVDRLEVTLNGAEGLIRRKVGFGSELEENAVNIAYAIVALQNNYDLPTFSDDRQRALNALVANVPEKVAPALIEEFFKNQYSTEQRFLMLSALTLGARELAGLPPLSIASSTALISKNDTGTKASFPSKRLPSAMHRHLITLQNGGEIGGENRAGVNVIEGLVRGVVGRLDTRSQGSEGVEDAGTEDADRSVRERRLRMTTKPLIEEVSSAQNRNSPLAATTLTSRKTKTTYLTHAAASFIHPLLTTFFAFLHSENSREFLTQYRSPDQRYVSSGTGLILNPMVVEAFIGTTMILFDLARNSVEYLNILVPLGMELVLAIGAMAGSVVLETNEIKEQNEKEKSLASLLTPSLELAQLLLTSSMSLDNGRTLALEQTSLLLALAEWAAGVFETLEKGRRVGGMGGKYEERMWRSVVGVLSAVEDVKGRWGRSMLGLTAGGGGWG